MRVTRQPPRFLDLRRIRLPINALLSITHRVSGVVVFLLLPLPVYLFDVALHTPQGFAYVLDLLQLRWIQAALVLFLWGLLHHLFAGLRLLLIDVDIGVDLKTAMKSSRLLLWASLMWLLIAIWVVVL